ncbi:MAG: GntR family transcriptional regulator [Clostridiales bacterium]|nr:GntR family transcriptional regulator [Clostridiales bacterium]
MGIPMYMRIKQFIKSKIDSGEWTENFMIPSEAELSRQFGCSRITVTTAIKELVKEGMVYRVQGKGTFVAKRLTAEEIYETSGLFKASVSLEAISIPGEHVCENVRVEMPPEIVAKILQLGEEQKVITIVRTKYVDGKCFSVERVYLSYALYFQVLGSDVVTQSITKISEMCEIELGNSYMSSEPVLSDPEISRLLGVPENSPILEFLTELNDTKGCPVACEYFFTRGKSEKIQLTN